MMDRDIPLPDRVEGAPHPRETARLYGQDAAQGAFLQAFNAGRLHHGWLIHGPRGAGKATLAWRIARFLLATPDPETDGVTRWRRIDLQRVIKERFDVDYSVRAITDLLVRLGFSRISGRPRHPGQDTAVIDAFKKTSPGP